MRTRRAGLELGMELTTDEPRVRLDLDHLDQRTIRRQSAKIQSMLDERVAILVVDFVTMAVSLTDLGHAVNLCSEGFSPEPAWIRAESHRAAHVGNMLLIFH